MQSLQSETKNSEISSEFPFESKYLLVHGSNMHYVDEGEGDPIVFLHGNPTSSYLWRNIIPYVKGMGRVIAPDLIGMGKSEKPDLKYSFDDHYNYLQEFINKLQLKNITLVIHDWGSGLGFHYAAENPDNVKAIAFMEAMYQPMNWSDFPRGLKFGFKMMRSRFGWFMLSVMNMFVKSLLPQMTVRKLTKEEKEYYGSPYKSIKDRRAVRQWPIEVPISGSPANTHQLISNYNTWLVQSELPKLLFYAQPGAIIDAGDVKWLTENLKNLKTIDIGEGLHYIQEDNPHKIGEELAIWIKNDFV